MKEYRPLLNSLIIALTLGALFALGTVAADEPASFGLAPTAEDTPASFGLTPDSEDPPASFGLAPEDNGPSEVDVLKEALDATRKALDECSKDYRREKSLRIDAQQALANLQSESESEPEEDPPAEPERREILFFSAPYCKQPCDTVHDALANLKRQGWITTDDTGVPHHVRTVDYGAHPAMAARLHVDRLPTLILIVDGVEVDRHVGAIKGPEVLTTLWKTPSKK